MYIEKLASLIRNDVISGLRGYHGNLSMNMEQLEDEIVACRLTIINLYFLKGLMPIKDLLMEIDCIEVDCKSLESCGCQEYLCNRDTITAHFEIPLLISDFGKSSIHYLGSIDKKNKFNIVTSLSEYDNIKYRKRGAKKPFVWINYAPNINGMLDCFLFNAPFLLRVSIIAAFKDPRQLKRYRCCDENSLEGPDVNNSFIDLLIKDKLTKEKIYYYRLLAPQSLPNTQQYITGG